MLAATCPHCFHAIFADDEAALAELVCPGCHRTVGALQSEATATSSYPTERPDNRVSELPHIDTSGPARFLPAGADDPHGRFIPLVESDNPYAAPPADEFYQAAGWAPRANPRDLADLFERFFGRMIDGAYFWGVLVLSAFFSEVILDVPGAEYVFLLLAFAANLIQWILVTRTGQTIGKRLMGTRIVNYPDDAPVGFLQAVVLRMWIATAIATLVPFGPILDALFIFGPERRCLHDVLARTRVVSANRTRRARQQFEWPR